MLVVDSVHKRFGAVVALDDVSLSVTPGQIVGFLGPNGAGKTSAMRVIMGLIAPDAGYVSWQGERADEAQRTRFGYMPAERGMYPKMTVRAQVEYFARLTGLTRADARASATEWMERMQIDARADDQVQALSSGNQQRVQLAIALVHRPSLLILDEPFSGLDPMAVETMKAVLTEQAANGTAVLFSSHQLDLVSEICRDVVIIDSGKVLLTGDVDEIRRRSPQRYATVTFAEEIFWRPGLADAEVVERSARTVRLVVPVGTNPATVLDDASAAGEVAQFGFAPPDLSEVFLRTVEAPGFSR